VLVLGLEDVSPPRGLGGGVDSVDGVVELHCNCAFTLSK
jgi:hypothetical protein